MITLLLCKFRKKVYFGRKLIICNDMPGDMECSVRQTENFPFAKLLCQKESILDLRSREKAILDYQKDCMWDWGMEMQIVMNRCLNIRKYNKYNIIMCLVPKQYAITLGSQWCWKWCFKYYYSLCPVVEKTCILWVNKCFWF